MSLVYNSGILVFDGTRETINHNKVVKSTRNFGKSRDDLFNEIVGYP